MPVILDENFNSIILDTTNVAVISENFSYLIKQLQDYVDPKVSNVHDKMPGKIGGQRRIERAKNSVNLGYEYKEAAGALITKSGRSKIINAFDTNILVDEWTVSHGHVKDPKLGEEYPTTDSNGEPRGPYTCLMTARISLSKKTPTRCYISCNCKDFDTKFYERLNQGGYTLEKSFALAKEPERLAPAMCKHLYAIYIQHYRELVKETEGFVINSSPVLFGGGGTVPTGPVNLVPPVQSGSVVARTKKEAFDLIQKELKTQFDRIKNNPTSYLDSRGKSSGGGRHHLYPFFVARLGGTLHILYRNKTVALTAASNGPFKVLEIPKNPAIWGFMKHSTDHQKLVDMIHQLGEMPTAMNNKIKKMTGMGVYMENVADSSIMSSILELS